MGLLIAIMAAVGCDSPEPVIVYTVPTTVPPELRAGKERMLAAMLPKGDQVWFFKVTGPEEAIAEVESTYRQFVQSIEFENGAPNLKELPEGWRRGAEKPMRFASIDVETPNKQLDISISKLGRQSDWDNFVAMNVNRWRGQLGLASSQDKWAGGTSMEAATADGPSVWVDLVGEPSSGGGMSPPPMVNRTPPPAREQNPPRENTAANSDPPLKFDRPDGWRDGRMSSMRMAAFNAGPESSQAELTVIQAGGDVRGNVARWLGQVRGEGVPENVVDEALANAQKVEVDGRPSQRFLLTGSDAKAGDAIDVTIVPMENGISLFVKMQGPAAVVSEQSEKIASFLESLKLNI